jgi:hypothetical protein
VNLVEPGSLYGDRMNRIDVRVGRDFRSHRTRIAPFVDVLNVLNSSPVLAVNTTYGSDWQHPTSILGGRMVKLGAQLDF